MSGLDRPLRVLLLGGGGFVGRALAAGLARLGHHIAAPDRAAVDLTGSRAASALRGLLGDADVVAMAAAITPDAARRAGIADAGARNLAMARVLAEAAAGVAGVHVVHIGSDTVYGLADACFDESTTPAPDDDYGASHLAREQALAGACPGRVALLRLSQVYGPGDTHNAYGPCRFARQALAGEPVALFGQGEDRRDHIWIDDVVDAVARTLVERFTGTLCVSAGASPSFAELAALVCALVPGARPAQRPRRMPAVARRFDNTRLRALGMRPRPVADGVPLLLSAWAAGRPLPFLRR